MAEVAVAKHEHRASFRIGHMENNGAPRARDEFYYFSGIIDDVMGFDRALTDVEVQQRYQSSRSNMDAE